MTGAMCVIAPGSSLQLLVAVLVTLMYMLLVLKTAPYEEDSEDYTSFVACLTLTLTTVGGLLLITDIGKTPTYESTLLGGLLVGMAVSCIVVEIGIVVLFDCGMYEKIHNRIKDGKKSDDGDDEKDNEGKENEGDNISVLIKQTTKVTPVSTESEPEHTISIADTMEMHAEEVDQLHRDHDEHDKRFKQKHEILRKQKTNRVQERLRARTALKHSKTLQKTKMFHDLSSDTISKIINVMELRTFEMSQNLVTQGDDASEFMVIMKGAATVYHDGNQVRNFGSLDFLGEGALVDGEHKRGATVTADTPMQVLVLSFETYQELLVYGVIEQKTQERVKRMSKSYTMEDAKRLKEMGKILENKTSDNSRSLFN